MGKLRKKDTQTERNVEKAYFGYSTEFFNLQFRFTSHRKQNRIQKEWNQINKKK